MSRNLFIADLHFGHGGISDKFRNSFSSDEDHDETITENILTNRTSKRDVLWLLGDTFLKQESFKRLDLFAKHYMMVKIVLGNHCANSLARYALSTHKNIDVYGLTKKFGFWLSHAPIHESELYRANCVHGHTHNIVVDNPRYICVSCEQVDYKPVSLEYLRDTFKSRGV
jgi:calcineurin-like phosphoesterase family protein